MSTNVHASRTALRTAFADGQRLVGTFVKLPSTDVIELCSASGFDFVVVDLEHSALSEADATALVRHADAIGLPALVRAPAVDAALINRLLESGAAGIQLSMLRTTDQARELVAATRYAPAGHRSISLANRAAQFGAGGLQNTLNREVSQPPVLVGQIESVSTDPLRSVIGDLDVVFVGSTDLAVDLGVDSTDERLTHAISGIETEAKAARVVFGGWAPEVAAADRLGLGAARYLIVGSDLQILSAGLIAARRR